VKGAFLDKFAGDPVKGVPSPSAQQTQHDMCKEAIKPKFETLNLIPPLIPEPCNNPKL
jgi:hypothetical protein